MILNGPSASLARVRDRRREHPGTHGRDAVATWPALPGTSTTWSTVRVAGWVGRGLRRGRGPSPAAPARSPGDRTTGARTPRLALPARVASRPGPPRSRSRGRRARRSSARPGGPHAPGAGPPCSGALHVYVVPRVAHREERKSSIFYMEVMGQDRTHPALCEGTHEVTGSLRHVPPSASRGVDDCN